MLCHGSLRPACADNLDIIFEATLIAVSASVFPACPIPHLCHREKSFPRLIAPCVGRGEGTRSKVSHSATNSSTCPAHVCPHLLLGQDTTVPGMSQTRRCRFLTSCQSSDWLARPLRFATEKSFTCCWLSTPLCRCSNARNQGILIRLRLL